MKREAIAKVKQGIKNKVAPLRVKRDKSSKSSKKDTLKTIVEQTIQDYVDDRKKVVSEYLDHISKKLDEISEKHKDTKTITTLAGQIKQHVNAADRYVTQFTAKNTVHRFGQNIVNKPKTWFIGATVLGATTLAILKNMKKSKK